jgi:hypothetical protein
MPASIMIAKHVALVAGMLIVADAQASDLADSSTGRGFLSKDMPFGSDDSRITSGNHEKFIIPNLNRAEHGPLESESIGHGPATYDIDVDEYRRGTLTSSAREYRESFFESAPNKPVDPVTHDIASRAREHRESLFESWRNQLPFGNHEKFIIPNFNRGPATKDTDVDKNRGSLTSSARESRESVFESLRNQPVPPATQVYDPLAFSSTKEKKIVQKQKPLAETPVALVPMLFAMLGAFSPITLLAIGAAFLTLLMVLGTRLAMKNRLYQASAADMSLSTELKEQEANDAFVDGMHRTAVGTAVSAVAVAVGTAVSVPEVAMAADVSSEPSLMVAVDAAVIQGGAAAVGGLAVGGLMAWFSEQQVEQGEKRGSEAVSEATRAKMSSMFMEDEVLPDGSLDDTVRRMEAAMAAANAGKGEEEVPVEKKEEVEEKKTSSIDDGW